MCSIAYGHTPIPNTNVWPEGDVVVSQHLFCFIHCDTISYERSFITCPISHLCAQICPYYLFLLLPQYDVACCVSEPHMPTKFEGLILFGLSVT